MRNSIKHAIIDLALWAAIMGGLFWFLFALAAKGAPAPLPKAPVPPARTAYLLPRDFVGKWVKTWGGSEWNVRLSPDGDYVAWNKGTSIWVGQWRLDGAGRLCVTEVPLNENGLPGQPRSAWAVTWARDGDGRFDPRRLRGSVARPDGTVSVAVTLTKKGKR